MNMGTLADHQKKVLDLLETLVRKEPNWTEVDNAMFAMAMCKTIEAWADKRGKEAAKLCEAYMDRGKLNAAVEHVRRYRIKKEVVVLYGDIFNLRCEVRTPGNRLVKDKLLFQLSDRLKLSSLIVSDVMEKASAESEPAKVFTVEDSDEDVDDDERYPHDNQVEGPFEYPKSYRYPGHGEDD